MSLVWAYTWNIRMWQKNCHSFYTCLGYEHAFGQSVVHLSRRSRVQPYHHVSEEVSMKKTSCNEERKIFCHLFHYSVILNSLDILFISRNLQNNIIHVDCEYITSCPKLYGSGFWKVKKLVEKNYDTEELDLSTERGSKPGLQQEWLQDLLALLIHQLSPQLLHGRLWISLPMV